MVTHYDLVWLLKKNKMINKEMGQMGFRANDNQKPKCKISVIQHQESKKTENGAHTYTHCKDEHYLHHNPWYYICYSKQQSKYIL